MNDMTHPAAEQPQLRTLLLTDLCDSTTLVERLGDAAAAELFRAHDRLVLELQQRWRGRLIDRSDGLLLLFERPIDGLGFALDYARGLRELGHTRNLRLEARAGLHVGEVLTWRNSAAAVQAGAKPLEVEGLAKPLAGRLMALARPGQILLSATAEPLARRAARELGERAEHLLWKSHGRWRFKGLPEALEVHEVGEPGLAPLRAPKASGKAWRDTPLWRRPAALAAEVLLLVGIGIGAWFVTRPQPAIAFNERDWVVIADLRNLTGQGVLDDSLEQAFRISLEQSRHVNVLSDLKVRDTLQRMQRQPDTALDRAIASEIAIRDGARAVILPTVAEVGGRVRVSAEVVDPHTQTTVYTEYADGRGLDSTLHSIDKVTAALRERLGEELKAIERDSEPLPQVTTMDLDALRAYALGARAYARRQWPEALQYFGRAVQLDSKFALAHLGLMRVYVSNVDTTRARQHLDRAMTARNRLAPREQLYLDAWGAQFSSKPSVAAAKWKLLADMYPDFYAGHYHYAWAAFVNNDFSNAIEYARKATAPQEPLRAVAYELIARIDLAQGRSAQALAGFRRAGALGRYDPSRRVATALAAMRRFREAEAALKRIPQTGIPSGDLVNSIERVTMPLDRGRCHEARSSAAKAAAEARRSTYLLANQFQLIELMVRSICANDDVDFSSYREVMDAALRHARLTEADERSELVFVALAAAYASQRWGGAIDDNTAQSLARAVDETGEGAAAKLLAIVNAQRLMLLGDTETAIAQLKGMIDGRELFQTHVALRDALRAAGRLGEAMQEDRWLVSHRGLAYIEAAGNMTLQALNVADANLAHLDAAEMLQAMGHGAESQREAESFRLAWSEGDWPAHLRRRLEVTLSASKQNTTVWDAVEVR